MRPARRLPTSGRAHIYLGELRATLFWLQRLHLSHPQVYTLVITQIKVKYVEWAADRREAPSLHERRKGASDVFSWEG